MWEAKQYWRSWHKSCCGMSQSRHLPANQTFLSFWGLNWVNGGQVTLVGMGGFPLQWGVRNWRKQHLDSISGYNRQTMSRIMRKARRRSDSHMTGRRLGGVLKVDDEEGEEEEEEDGQIWVIIELNMGSYWPKSSILTILGGSMMSCRREMKKKKKKEKKKLCCRYYNKFEVIIASLL